MESVAAFGAVYFCSAAHYLTTPSVEMTACGSDQNRFAIGLFTSAVIFVLGAMATWRLSERWR